MAPSMSWNPETDQKLLIFLLATNPKIKLDFEGAAKVLSSKECTCTARAVQERFKKIRQIVKNDPKFSVLVEQAANGHGINHLAKPAKRVADESDEETLLSSPTAKKAKMSSANSPTKVTKESPGSGKGKTGIINTKNFKSMSYAEKEKPMKSEDGKDDEEDAV